MSEKLPYGNTNFSDWRVSNFWGHERKGAVGSKKLWESLIIVIHWLDYGRFQMYFCGIDFVWYYTVEPAFEELRNLGRNLRTLLYNSIYCRSSIYCCCWQGISKLILLKSVCQLFLTEQFLVFKGHKNSRRCTKALSHCKSISDKADVFKKEWWTGILETLMSGSESRHRSKGPEFSLTCGRFPSSE